MQDTLETRELLYAHQQQLLDLGGTVIQAGLNMPGGVALYPWTELMQGAKHAVMEAFAHAQIEILHGEDMVTILGPYCLWATGVDGLTIKKLLVELEESSPCGRLWDLDVLTGHGPIDRAHLGLPPRKCMLCEDSAHSCRKLGRHALNDVIATAKSIATRCIHD